MTDERFVYTQDIMQKKVTARSSHNRKTHGGAVKFPSDYLTQKEKQAMNGEIETYRMNDPLTWKEFKKMPDDIKVLYIKALRERYGVPVLNAAEMMGVHPATLRAELARLNISGKKGKPGAWDKDGFYAWISGIKVEKPHEPVEEDSCEPVKEATEKTCEVAAKRAIPKSGDMAFEGCADDALETLRMVLGGANVRLCVSWFEAVSADG